jgi:signal transduction histidine kinase
MRRLSETLLRLARTGTDLRDPNTEVVDLDGVAREAVERIEALAGSAGLTLRVKGRGGLVWADYEWLEQALLIVLGNAVKHSYSGGEVMLGVEGRSVTIKDEGVGISETDLPYVFERFYRGNRDSDKEDDSGGFGLGLAICKELVERMGGSISLESEEGAGTKVEIELQEVGERVEDTYS